MARKHGVNANLLFGWRRLLEQCRDPASLLPVTTPTVLPNGKFRPASGEGCVASSAPDWGTQDPSSPA